MGRKICSPSFNREPSDKADAVGGRIHMTAKNQNKKKTLTKGLTKIFLPFFQIN
jgi:hypothetical protein